MLAALPDFNVDLNVLNAMRHVALAVSGGSDSMALLRLVAAWSTSRVDPPRLSVLTVDHGLRDESASDARQVAAWTRDLGLPHHTLMWTGAKPRTGLQSKARKARYDLMVAWCRANDADAILTGHTRDDQAETVLMRLARTKSPASLSGIPAVGQWDGVVLVRPLLALGRQSLRDQLQTIGQAWIDDPSNVDPRFERVRIRRQLAAQVPREISAGRLAHLSVIATRVDGLLDRCAGQWINFWLREDDAGVCFAPLASLDGLPPLLQQRILAGIVGHYGGGALKPEAAELARLCSWLFEGTTARCTLGGAVVGKRKSTFWVTRETARIDSRPVVLENGHEIIWDGRFAITGPGGATVTAAGEGGVTFERDVPVHARRAYPRISAIDIDPDAIKVRFLRLCRP